MAWPNLFKRYTKLGLSFAKLSISWSWLHSGSIASLKVDCLVQTGTITAKILNTSGEAGHMFHGQMLNGQMLHGQMLHGQMVVGHL